MTNKFQPENPTMLVGAALDKKQGSYKKKNLKLLIVEDNDSLREYLEHSMESRYETKTAENGKVALEMIEKCMPDMIISDVGMPEMDGIALTNHLKSTYETSIFLFYC